MLTIALIGPDGCGKTTVARRLERSLPWPARYVYMGVSLESSNLMLPTSRLKLVIKRILRRPTDTTGPRDKTQPEHRPKGLLRHARWFVKQSLRLANQVAEETFRQLVVRWHRCRGRTVILDRDFFADYYAYDIAGTGKKTIFRRIHGWLLQHVYKKPDLVIYLDVSGETMFARKGEGSVDLLNRRREDYRQLRDVLPSFAIVDAEQPLVTVMRSVQELIRQQQAHRPPRRIRFASGELASFDRPMAVLVGIDCVSGLQTARCLTRRGIAVLGLAKNIRHYCCHTRVCQRILRSGTTGDALIETLLDLGPALPSKAALFPCTDLSVLTISEHRDALEPWFSLTLPDHSLVELFTDKVAFANFAKQHQIPFPKTQVLRTMDDARTAGDGLEFPCYVKPAVKTENWESKTKAKVIVVRNASDLIDTFRSCSHWSDSLLVQEEIVGPVTNHFTCDMYFDQRGRLAAAFTSRKLRQWPPKTGTGCLSVECNSSAVKSHAVRVFAPVAFRGFAYVELKRDSRTGRLKVIETNVGRPTGRSAAAVASGVDLAYSMYCDLTGQPLPIARQARATGRKWIHGRRDFQAAVTHWSEGTLTVVKWLRSLSRIKSSAVFSWRDPGPWIAELWRYSLMASRAIFRRLRRVSGRL